MAKIACLNDAFSEGKQVQWKVNHYSKKIRKGEKNES